MQDEYGAMTSDGESFVKNDFVLENKQVLAVAQIRYMTYGTLNQVRDNVLVVCHALTGNASLHAWWGGLLGEEQAFDTSKYFIICCNILGSCYGSTNPTSIDPNTGKMYAKEFPDISTRDTVRLQLHLLKDKLKIASVKCVIGGSFGGMQALEYAVQAGVNGGDFICENGSPYVKSLVLIACGASHTAWQIAISEVQRQAIYADPNWEIDGFKATKGLEVARQIGMVSYRAPAVYCKKYGRNLQTTESAPYGSQAAWQVKSYLEYQGIKFIDRFDPITYVKLTEQMDSHDVSRGRGDSVAEVLARVEVPACVLGIDSDVLYPLPEQQLLASYLQKSKLHIIHSEDGHDGFLLEQEQVSGVITNFLDVSVECNAAKEKHRGSFFERFRSIVA